MNRVRRTRAKAARMAGGWNHSRKRAELPKDAPIRRSPLAVPFAAPVLSFFGRFRFISRGPIRSQCERLSRAAYASISPRRFPVSLGVSDQDVWKKSSTSGIHFSVPNFYDRDPPDFGCSFLK